MPDLTQFAVFFAAAALLAVTPGPGIFYVAARALAGGRAEGIASSLGTALGGLLHVLAGALGVSALVMASAEWFTALKWLGAAYLVWLGVRTIRCARREADVAARNAGSPSGACTMQGVRGMQGVSGMQDVSGTQDVGGVHGVGVRRAFREGMWVEALNPKTAAFFLAFIPQFVDPAAGSVPLQFIVLGLVSVTLNTAVDIVVACAAARIRAGATGHPTRIRRLREASGAGMMALGVGMLFARRSGG